MYAPIKTAEKQGLFRFARALKRVAAKWNAQLGFEWGDTASILRVHPEGKAIFVQISTDSIAFDAFAILGTILTNSIVSGAPARRIFRLNAFEGRMLSILDPPRLRFLLGRFEFSPDELTWESWLFNPAMHFGDLGLTRS